jgi:hypothetical protein
MNYNAVKKTGAALTFLTERKRINKTSQCWNRGRANAFEMNIHYINFNNILPLKPASLRGRGYCANSKTNTQDRGQVFSNE